LGALKSRKPALDAPCEANGYLQNHVRRLLASLLHWTGRSLIEPSVTIPEQAHRLFFAPFVVLSHNTDADPLLNYANQAGLRLFGMTWDEMIRTPSRLTAEPAHRAERTRLLATVSSKGYIDDYRGVRISKTGCRFMIDRATVWNLIDDHGAPYGQAATFSEWKFLDGESGT
jgi:hypothetical protein